jgi:hypothetical protein
VKVKTFEIMKKIAAGLLAVLIATSSFGAYKAMHKKKRKQVKKTTSAVQAKLNIKSVLMGRSACFGKCPTYTIEIFETGMLRYTGKSFVEYEGVYEKNMGKEQATKLISEFSALRPDTLKYLYEKRIPDLPGVYYFISYPDSLQKVLNADAGPEFLKDWAKKFDEIGKADDSWKKVSTPANK